MLKEFRNFIMTGNVIDLAVAVILAGAVGLVVNGFVSDVMMPIIGHFAGGMDFADLKYHQRLIFENEKNRLKIISCKQTILLL